MTIPHDRLAETFLNELYSTAPIELEALQRTGAALQRMVQAIAPHAEGGITLTQEDIKQFASRYIDYYQSPRQEPLAQFVGQYLQEKVSHLTAEGREILDFVLQRSSAAQQVQERRAAGGERQR